MKTRVEVIRETLDLYVGPDAGRDDGSFMLLCPAHRDPETLVQALDDAIGDYLAQSSDTAHIPEDCHACVVAVRGDGILHTLCGCDCHTVNVGAS